MKAAKIMLLLLLAGCVRMMSLDDFLFEPTTVDEYLRSEDLEEWGTRFIIPDSLVEPVVLTSMGNSIYGFFVKGDPDSVENNGVTILYCHGRSDNINRYWVRVEYLWEMGFNVFIFDYQGYGMSEGSPTGEALYSDGVAALDYVRTRVDVDPSRIVYYGWSLGTFVATYLAADIIHPSALILEAAIASATVLLRDSALLSLTGSYVVDADFDNEKRIDLIASPLLMMHGREDDYIVFDRHVPLLWDKAVQPKESLWVDDAAHDDIPETLGATYHATVIDFIHRHVSD
ncbi:MAG: alpha/beta hydrolase [candidate division WOR-3 bacterium]|nr:MAG: alpha/beta hydrolase [candidate division WOR-3 bacterium]